jgi:hypothetical protein
MVHVTAASAPQRVTGLLVVRPQGKCIRVS